MSEAEIQAQVAAHIAAHGVTRCPAAYADVSSGDIGKAARALHSARGIGPIGDAWRAHQAALGDRGRKAARAKRADGLADKAAPPLPLAPEPVRSAPVREPVKLPQPPAASAGAARARDELQGRAVEARLAHNQEAGGSNPPSATKEERRGKWQRPIAWWKPGWRKRLGIAG